MAIKNIALTNFRNYKNLSLKLETGISVFTGTNGIGKTTILEAISVLGSGRSFRLGKNEDFIRHGEAQGNLAGDVELNGLSSKIKIEIHSQGKKVFLDNKYVRRLSAITNLLPSVVFSPGDHRIIEGDSADRKNFLNRAASILDYSYAENLSSYNRVLTQRNQLLKKLTKEGASFSKAEAELSIWDDQLKEHGLKLMEQRRAYIGALQEKIIHEYDLIAGKRDQFMAIYVPLGNEEEIYSEENFTDAIHKIFSFALKDSLRRDLVVGTTSAGPHKDEILLTLGGNKVKFYGSQGEKRTCALALRLGEVALFKEKHRRAPVLLIDDVSSELDSNRRRSLVELLQKEDAQVFITATELPSTLMKDLGKSFQHWDLVALGEDR